MRCIDELSAEELRGKCVLLRADFNLPIGKDGEPADRFRLMRGWKTVQFLRDRDARVIIVSHIGRKPEESLEPVVRAMKRLGNVTFIPDLVGAAARGAVRAMRNGDVVCLENLRREMGEAENEVFFARSLASLADLYVDDAFAAAHREHASIVGVPKLLPSFAGLLFKEEIEKLSAARTPHSPSLAILGGAKFETKVPLIKLLLERYDHLFIAGALANDIFRARGYETGRSLTSHDLPGSEILEHAHFLAPVDVTTEKPDGSARVKNPANVEKDEIIVDIGPDSVALLSPLIASAQCILWNGPTGIYERGYNLYTTQIAELIAARRIESSVVIGGGDTIAALEETAVPKESLGFLSTGGGAMLEYLLRGTLPGIEALG